jgi:nucleoside-diphosphate-sugar epimerase
VLTQDLAGYLAAAVDAPGVEGQRIDIGWDRPVSLQEMAKISGELLGQQIRVLSIPAGVINAAGAVVGRFSPMVSDMAAMLGWFPTGRYVADVSRQREVFGPVPTAEAAIARLLGSLGHTVTAQEAKP